VYRRLQRSAAEGDPRGQHASFKGSIIETHAHRHSPATAAAPARSPGSYGLDEVLLGRCRAYRAFLTVDESELRGQKSNAQHYQAIADIRGKRELYFQLAATRHFEERLEQF
jgi:hypothetical protein